MEGLDLGGILGRSQAEAELCAAVARIRERPHDPKLSKGIFVSGPPGCGKSSFVAGALRRLGYDTLVLGAGDVRNKEAMEGLASGNIAERSVISMFHGPGRPLVIVLDDADCLGAGGGDKGAATALVRLIRPQKSRRQLGGLRIANPVVCVGCNGGDKRTKEIAAACTVVQLQAPVPAEMRAIVGATLPGLCAADQKRVMRFASGNLHQLALACELIDGGGATMAAHLDALPSLDAGEDSRGLARRLMAQGCPIEDHGRLVCDVDRAILGLMVHENIPRLLGASGVVHPYVAAIGLFCEADCLDRTAFQRQVWQLSELCSLLKNLWTTQILQEEIPDCSGRVNALKDVRFTRVLTKYSAEYSNMRFIQTLCNRAGIEKSDLWAAWGASCRAPAQAQVDLAALPLTRLELSRLDRYFGIPDP